MSPALFADSIAICGFELLEGRLMSLGSAARAVDYCAKIHTDHKVAFEMALEEPAATIPIFAILLLLTNQSPQSETASRPHTEFKIQWQLSLDSSNLRPSLSLS